MLEEAMLIWKKYENQSRAFSHVERRIPRDELEEFKSELRSRIFEEIHFKIECDKSKLSLPR